MPGNPVDPRNGVGNNPILPPTLNLIPDEIDEGMENPTTSRILKRQFSARGSSKLHEIVNPKRDGEFEPIAKPIPKLHPEERNDVEKPLSHQKRKKDIQTEERSRRSEEDLDNLVSPSADSDVSQSVRNSG